MHITGIHRFPLHLIFWMVISILLIIPVGVSALPERLGPRTLVNDYTELLSTSERAALEQKLSDFAASNQVGITVIITDTLYGLEIADFSARIGEEWGVGKAGDESGIVITVVPSKQADVRGEVFIATGYGMEGAIPDATARRIVENEILPSFRQEKYYEGLDGATTVLMQLAAGDFPASEYGAEEVPSGAVLVPFLMILVIFIVLSRSKRRFSSPGKSIPIWSLFWLLGHGSRGNRGSFGDFSSGRGSFGRTGGFGGGGGGFSGFGGGRFGGGGAGGSW